jgi:hypothetical protein
VRSSSAASLAGFGLLCLWRLRRNQEFGAQGIFTFTVEWQDLYGAAFLDEKLRGDSLVPFHQK